MMAYNQYNTILLLVVSTIHVIFQEHLRIFLTTQLQTLNTGPMQGKS